MRREATGGITRSRQARKHERERPKVLAYRGRHRTHEACEGQGRGEARPTQPQVDQAPARQAGLLQAYEHVTTGEDATSSGRHVRDVIYDGQGSWHAALCEAQAGRLAARSAGSGRAEGGGSAG